jgi:hypothetical protein
VCVRESERAPPPARARARERERNLFWRSLEILDTKGVDSDDLDPEVQAPFEAPVDTCVL